MAKQPKGLGKGLGALLGKTPNINRQPIGYVNKNVVNEGGGNDENADSLNASDIFRVPISAIKPNPFQPRKTFDQESLDELADSIKTLGLIQPITVRKMPEGKYQIISGERRYRASKLAGLDMIPAYIRDASEQGMLEMAIVENIQRENLDPIEIAMSYQRLIDECTLTQEEMAARVGKKRASVSNYLRLLKLSPKIQHDLKVGLISVGHAKVLLGVEESDLQEQLCDLIVKEELSVRQLEEHIRKQSSKKTEAENLQKNNQSLPDEYYRVLEHIGKYFNNNISLKRSSSGKGTMTIGFDSDEEIKKFLTALDKIYAVDTPNKQ